MTNYYIEKENKIVLFDTNKQKLISTLGFMPQYKGLEIQETENEIINYNDELVFASDVQEELLSNAKEAKIQEATDKAYQFENKYGLIKVNATTAETQEAGLFHIEATLTNNIKLSAYAQSIDDTSTLPWNTKENINILLNKTACETLTSLMSQLNAKLWTVDFPTYLAQIDAAQTVDEVNAINIEYQSPQEVVDITSELIAYNQPSDII